MTFATDSYYWNKLLFRATCELLTRRLISWRWHLFSYCFCILLFCYPSWHHYYRPTRVFCAHSPLICVCHSSVDLKTFTAVQPLLTAVSVCSGRPPESAEKNNVLLSANWSLWKTGRAEADGKGNSIPLRASGTQWCEKRRGGGEERGIKKEKEERDREGGGRAGDKKRKMTSSQLNGRGGAIGCGRAGAPLAGVRAWIQQRGFDRHPIGLFTGNRKNRFINYKQSTICYTARCVL